MPLFRLTELSSRPDYLLTLLLTTSQITSVFATVPSMTMSRAQMQSPFVSAKFRSIELLTLPSILS